MLGVADRFSRKYGLFVGGIVTILSAALMSSAYYIWYVSVNRAFPMVGFVKHQRAMLCIIHYGVHTELLKKSILMIPFYA